MAVTNYPHVNEAPLDARKEADLPRKTLNQASIRACIPLPRLIVFPGSSGLAGIQTRLSQESNYRVREFSSE